MNRMSSFGRTFAWILLAVCLLPAMIRAEEQALTAPGSVEPSAVTGEPTAPGFHRLTAIEATPGSEEVRVYLETDGKVTARPFVLDSPDRLVVDLQGVQSVLRKSRFVVDSPLVSRVRVGQHQDGATPVARIVLDLNEAQPYRVEDAPGGVLVTVGGPGGGGDADTPASAGSSGEASPLEPAASAPSIPSAAPEDGMPPAIAGAGDSQPQGADAEPAEDAPAQKARAEQEPPPEPATAGAAAGTIAAPPPTRIASLGGFGSATRAGDPPVRIAQAMGEAGSDDAPRAVAPTSLSYETQTINPEKKVYTGKKISLNLVDADIKQVFRLFHEISGLNFVLDPGVSGNVTIVLDEVPWDQALDLILRNNSLDKVYENNVVRIATTQKLATEASSRKALRDAKELEVEPVTVTRRLSYAKAREIDQIIKTGVLLSQRGKSFFDDRTNTLIITDVPTKVDPLSRLIETLDEKTPQVMIEARIVLTGRDFIQDLGIDWGFTFDRNTPRQLTGNNFPHSGDVTYGLHLPRAAAANQLAFNLFNRSGSFELNVALDALETDGRSRTLSAPKIATQNNVKAEIEQGVQIPIANSTATEINVQFVSASLRLSVLPQITAEGTVIMDILVENNSPSDTVKVNTIPGIDTQRAQTRVMVEDGGTTVIGGIFQVKDSRSESGVPWLRKVPVLGWLFKSRNITTQNRELLIFITPKILRAA